MSKVSVWMNKQSADLVLVQPYFDFFGDEKEDMITECWPWTAKAFIGTVAHTGWLMTNRNDVAFVLPIKVRDQFEDLGEL